jgi:hypothetical protein
MFNGPWGTGDKAVNEKRGTHSKKHLIVKTKCLGHLYGVVGPE